MTPPPASSSPLQRPSPRRSTRSTSNPLASSNLSQRSSPLPSNPPTTPAPTHITQRQHNTNTAHQSMPSPALPIPAPSSLPLSSPPIPLPRLSEPYPTDLDVLTHPLTSEFRAIPNTMGELLRNDYTKLITFQPSAGPFRRHIINYGVLTDGSQREVFTLAHNLDGDRTLRPRLVLSSPSVLPLPRSATDHQHTTSSWPELSPPPRLLVGHTLLSLPAVPHCFPYRRRHLTLCLACTA